MKKYIVFDFDGTLLDTDQLIIDSRQFSADFVAKKLMRT